MTYSVKLRDKTVLGLDYKNAEDLKLRLASSKQIIMVEIGDDLDAVHGNLKHSKKPTNRSGYTQFRIYRFYPAVKSAARPIQSKQKSNKIALRRRR